MRMTTGLLTMGLLWALAAGPASVSAQPDRDDEPGMEDEGGPEGGPEEMEGRMPPQGPMGRRGGGRMGMGREGGPGGRMGMGRGPEGGPDGEGGGMGPGFRDRARGRMREMAEDPEVRKVMQAREETRITVKKLMKTYRGEKDAKKKEEIKAELKKALDSAFDADLAAQGLRIKKMEEELGKLKERIGKRKGMKQKIIDKKLGELSGDEEGWEW